MALDSLPDELKIEIIRILHASHHTAKAHTDAVAQVALCSRHYYHLALPILYSSFTGDTKVRALAFLLTIVRRPDLASFVQHLEGLHPGSDRDEGYSIPYSQPRYHLDVKMPGLRTVLEKEFDDEHMEYRWENLFFAKWYHKGGKWAGIPGNWESITALLMFLLPNLSTFKVPQFVGEPLITMFMDPGLAGSYFIPYVLTRAINLQTSNLHGPHSLSNLRKIEIGMNDDLHYPSLAPILPFLQLKSLREVSFPNLSITPEGMENDVITQTIPHITQLSFPESNIFCSNLFKILQAFPCLQKFSYIQRLAEEADPSHSFIPPIILDGLAHCKNTLQELTLINEAEEHHQAYYYDSTIDYDQLPPQDPNLPLGPLHEFTHLRRLDASAVLLVGRPAPKNFQEQVMAPSPTDEQNTAFVDSLPESLEELAIRACDRDAFAAMEVLFDRRRAGGLKRLKKVELYFQGFLTEEQVVMDSQGLQCEMESEELGIVVVRRGVRWFRRGRWGEDREPVFRPTEVDFDA